MGTPFLDRSRLGTATAAAVACLLFVVAGCGDSGDGDSTSDPAGQAASSTDGGSPAVGSGSAKDPALAGDVKEARAGVAAVDDPYEGLRLAAGAGVAATDVPTTTTLEAADDNRNLAKVCNLMSEQAKQQTI